MKKNLKKLLIAVFIFSFFFTMGGLIIYGRLKGDIFKGIEFSPSFTDRDGKLLNVYLTCDDKYRIYKPITKYSPEFLNMILLQEDQYFFNHHGVNPVSIWKAFVQTYIRKGKRIGGSTITMQVAKIKYGIYTKKLTGKFVQIIAALYLETIFSKQQILDFYLNMAPCGKNLEGFESAAWFYFNKTVSNLNFTEITTLCVLPQSPKERTPSVSNFPQELQEARKNLSEKWIKEHKEDENKKVFFKMKPQLMCSMPDRAIHYTRMLSEHCKKETCKTTISCELQTKCENFLKNYIDKNSYLGVHNGAILLYDRTTMEVLAAIGSYDYYNNDIEGQVNALNSKRSPGSTLKPFIYALALEQGIIHSHTMLKDTPITFSEYAPDNYGSVFKGPVFSWFALTDSRNIPAIYLANKIHNPDLYDYMKKSGITKMKNKNHYGLSLVLGSAEVSMMELACMYGALANGGIQKDLRLYFKSGKQNSFSDQKQMLSKESAYVTLKMLEKNVCPIENRPGETKNIPVAFKTGTSVGFKDCWTVAIFDKYIITVWLGNFDGLGNDAFLGRIMAAPLAFAIADSILIEKGESNFIMNVPENVKEIEVCSVSGSIPNENCPHKEKCLFIPGISPISKCKIHRKINIDTITGYRTDESPEENEFVKSVVREFWSADILQLFQSAGLPRLVPPDYPPKKMNIDFMNQGFAPQILSPMSNTKYIYRTDEFRNNHIVLQASCDSDSDEILWFCDDKFITRTKPLEKFIYNCDQGNFMITAIDSKARSSSININIQYNFNVLEQDNSEQ
ncbi:MAG: penicillin-binding protein 1C [Treponemataceae bacterium]